MTHPTADPDTLATWIGQEELKTDRIDPRPARLMQATLNQPVNLDNGHALPPLWHWLYFPPETATEALGPDGHPHRGGFLPPVALPRRMWAGGSFTFYRPLTIGATVTRRSTITGVEVKTGRSGPLCFVTVEHKFETDGAHALTEIHDIVYRDYPDPDAPARQVPLPDLAPEETREITPSMPLLFRYSALTFNAHRIHYDIDYCRDVEGYPGCIVHGPLIATLLIELAGSMAGGPGRLAEFSFRATAPVFHADPFRVHGAASDGSLSLWAETPDEGLAMSAAAKLVS